MERGEEGESVKYLNTSSNNVMEYGVRNAPLTGFFFCIFTLQATGPFPLSISIHKQNLLPIPDSPPHILFFEKIKNSQEDLAGMSVGVSVSRGP